MKRTFTILTAALALLAFLAFPMGMWGQTRESYSVTYDLEDLGDMFEDGSSYASANGYWKVPASAGESALISIPITEQPTSNISLTFHIATFGSGTNPAATNTTITAVGTESNSNWSGSGVSSYPSSSTYVNGVMTITMPENPTTLSGLEITMGVSSGVKIFRLQSITVEYTYGGGTPTPTTYTVTYDCNGGTSGCPENVTDLEAGDEITLADGPVKTDYDFAGWSDGNTTYDEGDTYTVNGNVTFTAQWTEQSSGDVHWVLTDLANLTTNDVFVIVGNNGSNYAMKNTGASNSGPVVVAVTVSGNELTGTIGDDIRWNVSGDATNGYVFYPNGSSTTWLYCIDNNNGLRIGSGNTDYNTFKIQSDYIYNIGRGRYVGIYNSQDWRSYTSINNNIKNQTFAFYKKVTGSLPPSITANNVEIAFNATSGEIEYTLNNPVATATLSANTNDSWITLGTVGSTSVPFTCSTNTESTARTATVTLVYVNGEATLVTKEVTVTQAAAPLSYTTIPGLFAAATGTETAVYVTFNNWVVSAVSTNGKNVFVTDNNGNGFVIYDNNGGLENTYAAGDILAGTAVSCNLKKYNGFAELLNVNATDLTITSGGTVSTANVALADLAGVNTGALLHYDNLTCSVNNNKYYLSDGTTNLQVYTTLYAFDTLVEGKTYNITGIYQQYNNTKEILPRSADDIEEVAEPSVTVTPNTIDAPAEGADGSLALTYENITDFISFDYYFCDVNGVELDDTDPDLPGWIYAEINEENDVYSMDYIIDANEGAARTAYMKVYTFDDDLEEVYAIVTVNQAAAPQQYTLTVEPFENLELITFVNGEMVMEAEGEIQVNDGDHIMLSIVAEEGYVMETLMVNGVDHVNDIAEDFTYEFDMPAEAVTINATAVEYVAPVGSDYVRINSLDQLTDGSIVVIAARYDEEHTNGYYAMSNASSGKPTGVLFTSTTSGNNETLPISITDNEDDYYWTVNVTENGYTFTNAEGFMIGYSSSTNFATGGSNTEWSIELSTSEGTAMVANYTGFVITNVNNQVRHFALNSSHNFGPYHDNNINNSGYNFILDFFLQSEAPVTETYTLDIEGYTDVTEGTNNKGYYLIASPVTVDPATVEGMTEDDFDLYYFDQSEENEWRNYEENTFSLVPGKGYLYAKKGNETYNFTLTGTPYDGDGEIGLDYDVNAEFPGFNLIGNPFATDATLDLPYYRLNEDGSALNTYTEISAVNVMEGVFVQATAATRTATFSTDAKRISQLNLKVTHDRSVVLDNAIIRFDGGSMLGKFQLNPDDTKIYITDGNEDFAVVCSAAEGEMPVSFRASENGTYTISVNAENVEATYLHLIDNMTGADVDLLATPSYSFEASTTDYTSRFKLSYKANTSVDENNASTSSTFAYYNGNAWVISNMGEATLQVVDMMGRVLSSESINGNVNVNLNQPAGIYMLRLVNGDNVKVQKVVVR